MAHAIFNVSPVRFLSSFQDNVNTMTNTLLNKINKNSSSDEITTYNEPEPTDFSVSFPVTISIEQQSNPIEIPRSTTINQNATSLNDTSSINLASSYACSPPEDLTLCFDGLAVHSPIFVGSPRSTTFINSPHSPSFLNTTHLNSPQSLLHQYGSPSSQSFMNHFGSPQSPSFLTTNHLESPQDQFFLNAHSPRSPLFSSANHLAGSPSIFGSPYDQSFTGSASFPNTNSFANSPLFPNNSFESPYLGLSVISPVHSPRGASGLLFPPTSFDKPPVDDLLISPYILPVRDTRVPKKKSVVKRTTPSGRKAKIHKCPYCQHISNRANNMKEHIQIHNPERPKPHLCKICHRPFARKHDMTRHYLSCKKNKKTIK